MDWDLPDELAVPLIIRHAGCGAVNSYDASTCTDKLLECVELFLLENFADALEKHDDGVITKRCWRK